MIFHIGQIDFFTTVLVLYKVIESRESENNNRGIREGLARIKCAPFIYFNYDRILRIDLIATHNYFTVAWEAIREICKRYSKSYLTDNYCKLKCLRSPQKCGFQY